MSLEELLVALAVTGILTLLLMDSWQMLRVICGRAETETDAAAAVYDTLSVDGPSIQERIDAAVLDSLLTIQEENEKTNQ